MSRWRWLALLGGLVVVALLLAWADSTLLRAAFPHPFTDARRVELRPPLPPVGRREARVGFGGLGPVGGLYSFWWFLAAGAGLILLTLGAVAIFPARVRLAAERLQPAALSLMFVAGIASALLVLALTLLMRATFFLLGYVPFLWAIVLLGVVFGLAAVALAVGRLLNGLLGRVNPLLATLAAALLLFDVALVPVLGWVVLLLIALTALGVAIVTRLGSPRGWGLEDLHW